MHPIKTVLLLQDLHLGGTQRHALELAKRLDPVRFETEVWTLMGGEAFLPKAVEYGLRVRQLARGPSVGPSGLWGLWQRLRSFRPDALMALTVVPNIWGRVLGRLAQVPVVVANCRGGDDLWRQHETVLKHLAHHHICNAKALKTALMNRYKLSPDRIDVIPTGVDTAHFAPRPKERDEECVLLCMARLSPIKDHETLIKAFELVQPKHPKARLRLVGDGELREQLARRMASSPARHAMELLPGTADPASQYAKASAVVLSSVNEGMPNVLLEAMAMGLPCVGTAVGGVPEVIRQGQTGFVVQKRDPQALSQALDELFGNEALRQRFGEQGRTIALAEHSLESVAERHAEVIERLVRGE
jgi:glycosyltransferase involved in cell wall biosynthesis